MHTVSQLPSRVSGVRAGVLVSTLLCRVAEGLVSIGSADWRLLWRRQNCLVLGLELGVDKAEKDEKSSLNIPSRKLAFAHCGWSVNLGKVFIVGDKTGKVKVMTV